MRLLRGDFADETVYARDPVAVARAFAAEGSKWIHVVDLDAARTGEPANLAVARRSPPRSRAGSRPAAACAAVEAAGGCSSPAPPGSWSAPPPSSTPTLSTSCAPRTRAASRSGSTPAAASRHAGWTEGSGPTWWTSRRLPRTGVAALIVTEIGRDGTLDGPDLDQLGRGPGRPRRPVVASGGVGHLDDLDALAELQAGGRRLAGAIVGRALYEGRFTLAEALAACPVISRPSRVRSAEPDHEGGAHGWCQSTRFLRRYRELLDAEDEAFDELDHAFEDGERALRP